MLSCKILVLIIKLWLMRMKCVRNFCCGLRNLLSFNNWSLLKMLKWLVLNSVLYVDLRLWLIMENGFLFVLWLLWLEGREIYDCLMFLGWIEIVELFIDFIFLRIIKMMICWWWEVGIWWLNLYWCWVFIIEWCFYIVGLNFIDWRRWIDGCLSKLRWGEKLMFFVVVGWKRFVIRLYCWMWMVRSENFLIRWCWCFLVCCFWFGFFGIWGLSLMDFGCVSDLFGCLYFFYLFVGFILGWSILCLY